MRFTFTEEQEKFRKEVKDFVTEELEKGTFSVQTAGLVGGPSREFSLQMAERGWIGITWPKEYGGQDRGYVDKMILHEELFKVQAPVGYHFAADRQVGPAIMSFGSDWQKEHFLPAIIKADEGIGFCLLFSEPNAGSDLASASTEAVPDGDHYVINGQKVWTSGAQRADYGWLLAKTSFDDSVRRHASFSEFIIDMKTPGITVRPIENMAGAQDFNEVFLDNVRIEKKFLVGTKNAGFMQIMAQMDYERAGIERLMQNYPIHVALLDYMADVDKEKMGENLYLKARDAVAQLEIEFTIGRLLCYSTAWMIDQGEKPTSQAAMAKAFCTQYEQRLNDTASRILGPLSQIKKGVEWSPFDGELANAILWGPSYTIQGGSVEVLKNIVAMRGLGLPRK